MDETDIKVNGASKYLYRAVDKAGDTVDFLLRAHRDRAAARRFFEQAIERSGAPEKVTIDKSGSNVAALDAINAGRRKQIVVRQIKYLNNIVEQDHRAIKRRTKPTLGFKDFRCARILLAGIELMHMIRKGQMKSDRGQTPAQLFYSLAAKAPRPYRPLIVQTSLSRQNRFGTPLPGYTHFSAGALCALSVSLPLTWASFSFLKTDSSAAFCRLRVLSNSSFASAFLPASW